ncbi:Choline transport ATP-binding protein OpuBA [Planctomycetes bacterium Pan216]|uniref:Choline transport ATP-binding protein OpuBA n=1 Tax=Kolteria novifilia TaxID=2527975 RepID=A0A518B5K1_9BACT|nr:Choline transport ATP-binding protein OpuBA [Planctomycetes bacterium Pan216]
MLSLRNIVKTYEKLEVLRDVSFDVEPGKTTVLIGPSGCGKSTLIRMMIGLIEPDRGEIEFESLPVQAKNLAQIRPRMGYVIQEGGLFPHMTARQNIALMARYQHWPRLRQRQRTEELAELTRFPVDGLDRFPAQLSGGQRQRVGLMRALMLDPDVLLMDEPLGALDPLVRYDLQEDLREIFLRLEKTVVLVTHDLGEAAFFGDSILLMRDGRIVQRGSIRDLIQHPAEEFVTQFVNAHRTPIDDIEEAAE